MKVLSLVSNVSLPQIPSRLWITLKIEETQAFNVTDQTDPNVTDEVHMYMNRHCILWTFMVRDLKYRNTY